MKPNDDTKTKKLLTANLLGIGILASAFGYRLAKPNLNKTSQPLGSTIVQAKARKHKSSHKKVRASHRAHTSNKKGKTRKSHLKIHRVKGKARTTKGRRVGPTTNYTGGANFKDFYETILFHNARHGSYAMGGQKSRWERVNMGRHKGFRYRLAGIHGSIKNAPSVYYRDIATLNYRNQAHAPVELDLKLTPYKYIPSLHTKNDKRHAKRDAVVFEGNQARVFHPGSSARIFYQMQFINNKTKKPAQLRNFAITESDIDKGQGIGLQAYNKPLKKTISVSRVHFNELEPGRSQANKTIQMGQTYFAKHRSKKTIAERGSVDSTMGEGSATFPIEPVRSKKASVSTTSTFRTQYVYDASGNGYQDEYHSEISPGGKKAGNYGSDSVGTHVWKQNYLKHANIKAPGEMFVVSERAFAGPKLNLVGSKTARADNPTDPKGWTSHLNLTNEFSPSAPAKTNFYYRLSADETYPKLMMEHHKEVILSHLNFADKQVDPGLTVDKSYNPDLNGVKLYTQNVKNGRFTQVKNSEVKKYLNVTVTQSSLQKKGSVVVSLKKPISSKTGENSSNKWLFNHTLSAIFHVKGNKNLQYEFTKDITTDAQKKANKSQWEADLYNASLLQLDDSKPTPEGAIVVIQSHEYGNPQLNKSHGVKTRYKMKNGQPADPSNDKIAPNDSHWDWDDYNGVVHPNQHITYMLHFKIGAFQDTGDKIYRYKQLTINDNLDSHIAKINHMYVSDHSLAGNHSGTEISPDKFPLTINRDNKDYPQFTKMLDDYSKDGKGGDLWVRYEATLDKKAPKGNNDKVLNSATLHPVVEGMHAGHFTGDKYETTGSGKHVSTEHYTISGYAWRDKYGEVKKYMPGNELDDKGHDYQNAIDGNYNIHFDSSADWGNLTPPKGFTTDAETNKVVNPYAGVIANQGQKQYSNKHYSDTTIDNASENSAKGETGNFIAKFRLGTVNSTIGSVPKQIDFDDDVDAWFFKVNSTKDIHIIAPNGKDVTSLGKFTVDPTKTMTGAQGPVYRVHWTITKPNVRKLPFNGGEYTMKIGVTPTQTHWIKREEFHNIAIVTEHIPGEPINIQTQRMTMEQGTQQAGIDKQFTYATNERTGNFIAKFRLGTVNSTIGSVPKQIDFDDDVDAWFFKVNSTKDIHIIAPNGKDVTSLGKFTVDPTKTMTGAQGPVYRVHWTITKPNVDKLPFNGGEYTMKIGVTLVQTYRIKREEFHNIAIVHEHIPGEPINVQTQRMTMEQGEPSTGDNDFALNSQDPYTVHYQIKANLGDTDDLSPHKDKYGKVIPGFKVTDQLPEHAKLDTNSIKIAVNKQSADGTWTNNASSAAGLNASEDSNGNLLVTGSEDKTHDWYNKELVIDYAVNIYPEADWSNYYNHEVKKNNTWGSAINANGNDHITNGAQLAIPNKAFLKTGSNTYESAAAFDVKAQLFKTQQYIVQDNDAWTDNLDPSHYLPHLRNDRSAVTTAVMLRMPNYLKLNSVEAESEAKTAGFSRDEAHMLRADQDLVHDPKFLHNPDFGKKNYAASNHFIGEWTNGNGTTSHKGWTNGLKANTSDDYSGSDTGNFYKDKEGNNRYESEIGADPKNLQDTSGKTFYLVTKWAPKTKFYHDYAKLGNMRTGFSAQVKLNATSLGKRQADSASPVLPPEHIDNVYKTKDVGIHLSNIYSYRDIIRDARYAQDGSTLDYRVFGKVKGLAVDKTAPTDFAKETNFGKAGMSPVETYINKNANAVSQTGDNGTVNSVPIKPDKPIKQDESYGTFTRIDKLPAKDYVGHKILQGYVSDSADTEIKGHSVMLTSDRTDSVAKGFDANTQKSGQGMNDTVAKAQKLTNQTLANIRFENDKALDPLQKQIMNKANREYTNPREYRLYLDYDNEYKGDDLQRVYREAYEAFMRNTTSAKAGYGLENTNKLVLFTLYDNHDSSAQKADDNNHSVLLNDYKTKESSQDGLFDNTYASNANNEYLDLTHMVVKEGHEKDMNGALQTQIKGNNDVSYLIDTKTADMPLAKACEAWASQYQDYADKHDTQHAYMGEFASRPRYLNVTTPDFKLSVINFQFNKRLLANGHQLYDQGKYAHNQIGNDGIEDQRAGDTFDAYSENTNNAGSPTEGIDGNFRNYIRRDAKLGVHELDLDSIPFGVGQMVGLKLTQDVNIYGAHYTTQGSGSNGSDNRGETSIQPALSGKDSQKIIDKNSSKRDNDKAQAWLKNNNLTQEITR